MPKYTVTKQFTDQSGRSWDEGDEFDGDQAAIQQALRNGEIREATANQQGQGQQTQNQAGQAKR